ncbi:MAG: ribonuclease [Bacteroidota bacterium]
MLYRLYYIFSNSNRKEFLRHLAYLLGFRPGKISLYIAALSHRSIKERTTDNNERLEYLGDAILGGIIADYLYMKYPYKGEGFLTEMRSKMVNRQMLNDIAIRMGLKKITSYNKQDASLKSSQIFGNALEALVGAIYIDKGYNATKRWVFKKIIIPHLFAEDLEQVEINQKNKLFSWANKSGKLLEFETIDEKMENGRRLFTVGAIVDGEVLAEGKAFNKKDAGQIAAQNAVEKLNL